MWKKAVPTAPGQSRIAEQLTTEGLEALQRTPEQLAAVAVTGYGKELVHGAHKVIDEVSANAMGAFLLSEGKARTVINIGGQDVKVIRLSSKGKYHLGIAQGRGPPHCPFGRQYRHGG